MICKDMLDVLIETIIFKWDNKYCMAEIREKLLKKQLKRRPLLTKELTKRIRQ